MSEPRFVTFEGGEGAGKSTQVAGLRARLEAAGGCVIATREPGGSPFAEQVRAFILGPEMEPHGALAEALLFSAARADHVRETIAPALAGGAWVLCDRFIDSTRVYQGAAGCVSEADLARLETLVLKGCWPDLTLVLDVPPEAGLERVRVRSGQAGLPEDRYETRTIAFHETLRAGFLDIARREPERCVVVDGTRPPDEVAAEIWRIVSGRFGVGTA